MSADPTILAKPTSADVAAVLRARTKDLDGAELGVFNENTRPTGDEVDRLITLAYDEVTGAAGTLLGERCAGLARALIVIRAAMWVEGSYWPEQVHSDRSIYSELADQFVAGMPMLTDCVAGNLPGSTEVDGEVVTDQRFGMLNVHGWTSVGTFDVPPSP